MSLSPVGDLRCLLGESPVWHAESNLLWLLDIGRSAAISFDPEAGRHRRVILDSRLTALVPRAGGGWLGISGRAVLGVDLRSGMTEHLFTIDGPADVVLNDAVCGRDGRLYLGSVDRTGAGRGQLYAVDPDGHIEVLAEHVGASNGVDTTSDGRYLYHADTFAGTVVRYPDGQVIAVDSPDGLAVDADDGVWIARWGDGEVRRYTSEGIFDQAIRVPVPRVTSVAFGGADLRTLFITSARSDELEWSGALFAVRPGVTGLQTPAFMI